MSDFAKLAKKAAAEDKPSPVIPQGTWRLRLKGGGKYVERKSNGNDAGPMADAIIPVALVAPLEDVHPDDVAALGDYTHLTAFHRIPIFTEADFWNVKRLFLTAGHSEDELNAKTREEIVASKGGEVHAHAKHRANPDEPARPFVDFKNIVGVS